LCLIRYEMIGYIVYYCLCAVFCILHVPYGDGGVVFFFSFVCL
jgi:hypothetical protein